jgi:hypothetical protein
MKEDLERKLNNVLAAYKTLQEDNERLYEMANMVHAKESSEYWSWQVDEDNHLESLTCPVLISAEALRELLDETYARGMVEGYRIKRKYNPGVR